MMSEWSSFGKCILFYSILVVAVMRLVATSSHLHEFKVPCEPQTGCDDIKSVVQSTENAYTYLATRSKLIKLDMNLNPILDRKFQSSRSDAEPRFILLRGSDLILCLNDDEGTCELWDASTLNETFRGYNKTRVTYPNAGFTLAWIAKDGMNGSDFINVAIPSTSLSSVVPRIPLVSTRILPKTYEPDFKFLAFFEDQFGSPKSFLPPSPCLTTKIEPVFGFSTSRFNYFLKRHRNDDGRIENKLARTCKPASTFKSYIELPLQCHNGYGASDSGKLSSAYFSNEELYAVFTKASDSNEVESYVCRYNINQINEQFTDRRRECLLGQTETTELDWYQYNTCPSKPIPSSKFNISQLDDPNFCYDLDTAYPLGGSKPILEKPLDHLTMQESIVAILVVPTKDGEVYLLGDNEGYIHKISSTKGTQVMQFDLGGAILPQNGLFLSNDNVTVYATSNKRIMAISLTEHWSTTPAPTPKPTTADPDDDPDDDPGDEPDGSGRIRVWVPFAWIFAIASVLVTRHIS